MQEHLQEKLNTLIHDNRLECAIKVEAHSGLTPGDGKLIWQDGLAQRDQQAIWQQIDALIKAQDFTTLAHEALTQPSQDTNEGEQA